MLSTARDTHGRRTVIDLVPAAGTRLYPVGRLDVDSTGLILVTNDGDLAQRMTHPRFEVPRTYRATVRPSPVPEHALRALREGVDLDDGRTLPAKVRQLKPGVLELTIREGRNHQVKRMCEAVGHRVRTLERIRFGGLRLDDLAVGAHRRLKAAEVERARCGEATAPRRRPRAPRSGHRGRESTRVAAMRLFALRGASSVDHNDAQAILGATEWLLREILKLNDLHPSDVVSCIFTLTDDLNAEFPAVAARNMGFSQVPLLCAREVPVPGALPRVIRVLMHYYAPDAHVSRHVYLGEARALRQDLEGAQ